MGLSKHALLVFIYLVRCANRQKGGICFPSIRNISKNCSIPSETTVREAIKELENRGLILKELIGRKNVYTINRYVYKAIDKANGIDSDVNDLEETPTYGDGIESEENEFSAIQTDGDAIPPEYDGTPTHGNAKYQHMVTPNKIKRTRLNKQNKEKENSKKQKEVCNIPSRGNITTSLTEVNEYYQALNDEQKKIFNDSARKLIRTGEVDPRHSIVFQRTIRRRMYELLLGLDKWKLSLPKLVEGQPFFLPMQTLKSKHEYVDALSPTVESKEAAL